MVESTTLPQQALLYRLSGDKNPLHADPSMAALGGFDRPILHGLCSFGIVCKAVVDHALDGDPAAVAAYDARFTGVLFPGETIVTSLWQDDGRILIDARCKERGTPVISNAAIRPTVRVPTTTGFNQVATLGTEWSLFFRDVDGMELEVCCKAE